MLDGNKLQAGATGVGPEAPVALSLADETDGGFNIGEYIATVMVYRWWILFITLLALLLGATVAYVSTPVFQADSLLQVEDEATGIASIDALDALQPLNDQNPSVSAEIEILRSRMILGQVVDKLELDEVIAPDYFPVVGRAVARRYAGGQVAKPWFGQDAYAWGGEALSVQRYEVPEALLGVPLTLTAGEDGAFTLRDEEETWAIDGKVGEALEYELANGSRLGLFVTRLKSRPGTRFTLLRNWRNDAIAELADTLSVTEKGKGSGIVRLSLSGHDRERLVAILDEIMSVYVRQNVERHSAEAENTLAFLERQLPELKEQLDNSEAAYNSYRLEEGSVDLTQETQSVLDSVVEIDNQMVALQQEREELRQKFKPQHPRLRALDGKIGQLQNKRQKLDQAVNRLPSTQQTILRLARDVEVNTHLYTELLNTAQQLRVAKAGTVGNVRIIDEAASSTLPIAPRKLRIMAVSLVLGVMAGLGMVWLVRRLRVRVEDPDVVERSLGLTVYATVPHSNQERKISVGIRKGTADCGVLAAAHPEDDAVESLRSLRTTLHFAMLDAPRGGLMITGPCQGIGKSFVSNNLAWLLADAGDKTVVVDTDLRRGHLHREFGVPRELGLSDFLLGAQPDQLIKQTANPNLAVVTCGTRPPNATELLMHPHFSRLIDFLLERFKHVILDAPPILAVSDAAIIGRCVGTTLMVVKSGQHPLAEIEQAVKRLSLAGVRTAGFIMNDLDTVRMRYRYGYSGYHYQYKYK